MKTVQINLYSFNELSEEVKKKVLDKHRYFNVESDFWYECIIDDWKDKLHENGF